METILLNTSTDDLIRLVHYYFNIIPRYTQKEICSIICNNHKLPITVRKLKYICKKEGLRHNVVDHGFLKESISNELDTSRICVGYRQMSEIIGLKYGINVSKENVRVVLKQVDPEGVEERTRKVIKRRIYQTNGPNEVYHVDGNDKLKMWGFCIHGAVDGFSRKLLWLKVATTNNNPLVIANFYLSFVKSHMIAPNILRMDKGTENIYLEDLQVFFTGIPNSFRYGASVHNQRIEAYWSRLKKFRFSWWKEFFQNMCRDGLYQSNLESHQEALVFCFLPVIQNELNEFQKTWNTRNVRKSSAAPGGKPDLLFSIPETFGYMKQGYQVDSSSIKTAEETIGIEHHPTWKSKDLHELLKCYMNIHRLSMPTNTDDALELYITLLSFLDNDNFEV